MVAKSVIKLALGILLSVALILPFVGVINFSDSQTAQAQVTTNHYGGIEESAGLAQQDLPTMIGNLIKIALGFLGILCVVFILLGGFKWMIASGNDDKLKEAKQTLTSGILGLLLIASAYAISSYLIKILFEVIQ